MQSAPAAADLPAGTRLARTVRLTIGGSALRLEVSNRYGPTPLEVRAGVLSSAGEDWLTFAGLDDFVIPAGAVAISDALPVNCMPGTEITLMVELPAGGAIHDIERTSDNAGATLMQPGADPTPTLPGIAATVEVLSRPIPVYAVLGDTKGARPGSWVDRVAEIAGGSYAMVNRSVFGGKLALGNDPSNGLARFDHDILATTGCTGAIIFCGNNDLIQPGMISSRGTAILDASLMQSEGQLRAILGQAASRARSAGLLAIGATWTPYEGVTIAEGYSTPEKMALRASVNEWMRNSGAFDAVIDFDAVLRDPAHPMRLATAFDEGNHFTPNAAGVEAMAQAAHALLAQLPLQPV